MNTSKQVNVMIGVLFLTVVLFGVYALNEGNRQAEAEHHVTEAVATRGARLFVNNCRSCHGMEGRGPEEGAVAPVLNTPAFRIIGEEEAEELGIEPTPLGEANELYDFLFNTIACGRTGTFMPTWSQRYGGPLSDTQIDQIVTMITEGRWDLVAEVGAEHDEETGETAEDILVPAEETGSLPLTQENCGQYSGTTALDFRTRDPFGTGEPADGEEPDGAAVQGLPVAEFFQASCAACHGADRQGVVGPALTPERLTEPDDFYFDTIKNGRPGTVMPAWGAQGLTDEEISTLVEFITTVEP